MHSRGRSVAVFVSVCILALGSELAVGCSSSGSDQTGAPKCIAGSTQSCLCVDGRSGVQSCNADGAYDACVCGGADGGLDASVDVGVDLGTDSALDTGTSDSSSDVVDSGSGSDAEAGTAPASCATAGDGRTNCGTSGTESCCASALVTGNTSPTFSRSYDGISTGYTDTAYKAQVSSFRLDKYEITVGRFRQYVTAVVGGWKPTTGAGKHTHLYGGSGLATNAFGTYEGGWDALSWNTAANFPTTGAEWNTNLAGTNATWTPTPTSNEKRPINYITWFDAEAFCIWDGGFLPSEAEWNYAGAGGIEQRVYAWSAPYPPGSTTISSSYAQYNTSVVANVGSKSPLGDGKWGQSDLTGNVWEWTVDLFKSPYNEKSCVDCAYLIETGAYRRAGKGGSFSGDANDVLVSRRFDFGDAGRYYYMGARCARKPQGALVLRPGPEKYFPSMAIAHILS